MRVALFSDTFLPKVDGIVTVICLLVDHLTERGIETVIVAPRIGDVRQYGAAPVISVPGVPFPMYPQLKFAPPNPATYRQIKAFKPDVAHFFHPVWVGLIGLGMAKWLRIPTVASFHLDLARLVHRFGIGFTAPFFNWATRVVFNSVDCALAPSRLIQRELGELGVRDVALWRRGVDAVKFHPRYRSDGMREQLSGGHVDDLLLLYVGRLSTEKQLHHLRPVLENVPGTRLALVGEGPMRSQLQAYFDGYPVRFLGHLEGEQLSQAYASADVFVFPSALETFGLVITEAMAAGLPVVASRVGGVNDVVRVGETGYTFDPGDIPALIDGVRQFAADRSRVKAMGSAARAFAETQSWGAMMDEVIDHYARVVEKRAATRRSP